MTTDQNQPPVSNVSGWSGIENAPYDTPVRVLAGRMTFIAILRRNASIDCDGEPCDQWQAVIEGEHPPCWTDGACWENNAEDSESLWPEAFQPLSADDRAALATTEGSDNGD